MVEANVPLKVRWKGEDALKLVPGCPINLPEELALRLLIRGGRKLKVLQGKIPMNLRLGCVVSWADSQRGYPQGEICMIAEEDWVVVKDPYGDLFFLHCNQIIYPLM